MGRRLRFIPFRRARLTHKGACYRRPRRPRQDRVWTPRHNLPRHLPTFSTLHRLRSRVTFEPMSVLRRPSPVPVYQQAQVLFHHHNHLPLPLVRHRRQDAPVRIQQSGQLVLHLAHLPRLRVQTPLQLGNLPPLSRRAREMFSAHQHPQWYQKLPQYQSRCSSRATTILAATSLLPLRPPHLKRQRGRRPSKIILRTRARLQNQAG